MTGQIRILTVDDHHLIRAGIASYLATEPGLSVVAEAANGEEALERYREVRPDLVLMDLSMPVMNGLEATRAIREEFPEARIIVLTTYDGDEDIRRALDAGAVGYMLKDMLVVEILATNLAEHTPRIALTRREMEVIALMAKGLTNAQIAQRIGRTEETVKVHVKNILQKLDAKGRTDAVTKAVRRGFIRL
jgi:DNA-binding NarL/FixJ family response regulator